MPSSPATFECCPTAHRGVRWCTPVTSLPLFCERSKLPSDKVHCAAYNVGTESNNLTVAEIAQSVVDVVPGAKLLITGETGSDPRSYRVDFSAFRHALGFEAAWSIPDGAAELYKEYISAGLTHEGFFKKFTRLPRLEALAHRGCSRRVDATDQDRCVSRAAQLPALASRAEITETGSGQSIARSGSLYATPKSSEGSCGRSIR